MRFTHLLNVLLCSHHLQLLPCLLAPLQPAQQLLAHVHRGSQLAAQLLGLLGQRRTQHLPGGLCPLPLLQGRAEPVDLLVLLVLRTTPDALQLQLLLLELCGQPLDLLQGASQQVTSPRTCYRHTHTVHIQVIYLSYIQSLALSSFCVYCTWEGGTEQNRIQ